MKILGLTGSIGMGKSATAALFKEADIAVFDSDKTVHDLMIKDGAAVEEIAAVFPQALKEGEIDRKILGAVVFKDAEALKKLESILHPKVFKSRQQFLKNQYEAGAKMVLIDVPLLFETGTDTLCDYIVVVTAPEDIQRERVLARENMTAEKLNSILAKQTPDEIKRQLADFLIFTDQGFEAARADVTKIIEQVLSDD
jgi:dephospho-CoA kinase